MFKTLLTLAFAFLVLKGASATIISDTITNTANGHVYVLLDQSTWEEAEAEAITIGGHLVTINDAAENDWVYDTFSQFRGTKRALWIGLNDKKQEGHMVWSSGQTSSFTYFYVNEPSNTGDEDFVHYFPPSDPTGRDKYWNDAGADVKASNGTPICGVVELEYTVSGTDESSSIASAVAISWTSAEGAVYQVYWANEVSGGFWFKLGVPVVGNGAVMSATDTTSNKSKRFYRVVKQS